MGAGRGARSAKGGCRGSLDLVLLVTHLGEVYCVCTIGETEREIGLTISYN
jgi:hypothetical protein